VIKSSRGWVGWAEGEDRMSASGEDRVSTFERHCGLLLRAYPASYRSGRAEEIIGTLLETTPEGRAWPLPRDIRSLVTGGLAARAALRRARTTAANLRIAVLVGVTAYFAYSAAALLGFFLYTGTGPARYGPVDWPQVIGTGLSVACALIAWVRRGRAIVLTFALPAAAAFVIDVPWRPVNGPLVTELACIAVLIALGGGERPNRGWLWPIGVVFLVVVMAFGGTDQATLLDTCLVCLVFASIVLLAIDARPVIALAVFLLALFLPATIDELAFGVIPPVGVPLPTAICGAAAALGIWRLRRQSAHRGRPRRI
jgi:hypothetical protein